MPVDTNRAAQQLPEMTTSGTREIDRAAARAEYMLLRARQIVNREGGAPEPEIVAALVIAMSNVLSK